MKQCLIGDTRCPRRVVYDPKGRKQLEYVWELQIPTNNKVEALVELQDLTILANKEVHRIIVMGDSMIIIRTLHY
jgi:hypothetical protein